MLWNLGFNIVVPTLILLFAGDQLGWPPWLVLVVALLGPLGYGIYELVTARKVNHVSVLGLVSVLATGGIGLLRIDAGWVAIKEAALPLVLGSVVLGSTFTRWPVVKTFLFDAEVLDVPRIEAAILEKGAEVDLERLMRVATFWIAGSFVLSAVLNYVLASYLVRSESGTAEFNAEIGQLTAWSFPVIVVPSMAITLGVMAWLLKGLQRITGLDLDDLVGDGRDDDAGAGDDDDGEDLGDREDLGDGEDLGEHAAEPDRP
jgi:intracellular septation protein A